ncbi:hypothetical protein J6590_059314 [Homalodisca vitripennis]|nr:hypothetical protein J6590_059314 [Homalodisca vitripennis]
MIPKTNFDNLLDISSLFNGNGSSSGLHPFWQCLSFLLRNITLQNDNSDISTSNPENAKHPCIPDTERNHHDGLSSRSTHASEDVTLTQSSRSDRETRCDTSTPTTCRNTTVSRNSQPIIIPLLTTSPPLKSLPDKLECLEIMSSLRPRHVHVYGKRFGICELPKRFIDLSSVFIQTGDRWHSTLAVWFTSGDGIPGWRHLPVVDYHAHARTRTRSYTPTDHLHAHHSALCMDEYHYQFTLGVLARVRLFVLGSPAALLGKDTTRSLGVLARNVPPTPLPSPSTAALLTVQDTPVLGRSVESDTSQEPQYPVSDRPRLEL